jgi:LPXTG-motif cell wall-anchored protein
MSGSNLGGLGGGSVLGASTAAVTTSVLPQTGSSLLLIVTISALVAIAGSLVITKLTQKLS